MKKEQKTIQIKMTPLGEGVEVNFNENDWKDYAEHGLEEWETCNFKKELLEFVNNDLNLAMVLFHWFGKNYRDWMIGIIPVLEGYTGIKCLDSELGKKRLKEVLMSMR